MVQPQDPTTKEGSTIKWPSSPVSAKNFTINCFVKVDFFFSISGCSSGIGKVTAHELSKRGAKVVMLCRDLEKADEAADDIRKDTGNVVSVVHLDLSSLESVRKCAEELHYNEDRIDILVNNAGKISNFSLSNSIHFCWEKSLVQAFLG